MNRLIVITGATRGLGRALVDEFVDRDHVVLGCGRDPAAVSALADAHPVPHDFAAVDVSDAEGVADWAARLITEHGAPHLVVNNAGLMNAPAPLWKVPAVEFGRLMDVNVDGIANVVRAFVPAMVAAGRGVVANLSSGWGRSTAAGVAPYCASKWAVEGLTRALAHDLPRPLAAVAVNPGIIDTDMLRQAWGNGAAAYPSATEWAPAAADRLLALGPCDNGAAVTV